MLHSIFRKFDCSLHHCCTQVKFNAPRVEGNEGQCTATRTITICIVFILCRIKLLETLSNFGCKFNNRFQIKSLLQANALSVMLKNVQFIVCFGLFEENDIV